jgi:two-component system, cell cycle response regulator
MMETYILVVDDDEAIRNSTQEFLNIRDYNAFSVSSAEEALNFMKTHHVDVIITDIRLNGMNGLELTQRIKDNYDSDIIVMTGYADSYSYEEAINRGADDFVFKPVKFEELNLRLKRVLKQRDLTRQRTVMLEKLKELAITDDLTKLYNSRHFYHQLEGEINRVQRFGHPLSLLLIDIDRFKHYNDTYGHLEGNKILHEIAKLITACLRTMDTAYRFGGEEFTVILPETPCDAALTVARRINQTVKNKFLDAANPQKITVSIGVSEYQPEETMTDFVKRTDQAMYLAKESGRDHVSSLMP